MKRRSKKQARAHLQRLFEFWLTPLGLYQWQLDVQYCYKREEFRQAGASDQETLMRCWANWEYMEATILVNLPLATTLSDPELERAVVHELCHALVNEMREQENCHKHEERVVTGLANAFIWTRDAARCEKARDKRRPDLPGEGSGRDKRRKAG